MAGTLGVEDVTKGMEKIATTMKQAVPAAPQFPSQRIMQDLAFVSRTNITTSDIKILKFTDFKPRARKVIAEMYLQEKAWKKEIRLSASVTKRRDLHQSIIDKLLRMHGTSLFIAAVEIPKPKARDLMNSYLMVNKNLQSDGRRSAILRGKDRLDDLTKRMTKVPIGFIEVKAVTPTTTSTNLKKEMSNNITRLYAHSNIIGPVSGMDTEEILFSLVNHLYKAVVQHIKTEKNKDSHKKALLDLIEDEQRRQVYVQRYSLGAFVYCICHTKKLADFLTKRFQPRFHYLNTERFLAGKLHEFEALMGLNSLAAIREALESTNPYKYVVFMHIGSSPDFAANPFHAEMLNGD